MCCAAIEFEDDRSLKAMASFIKENAKVSFAMPSLPGDAYSGDMNDVDPVDSPEGAPAGSDKDEL